MKNLITSILILVFVLFHLNLKSQTIKIIDTKYCVEQTKEFVEFELQYFSINDSITQLGKKWVSDYNNRTEESIKLYGELHPEAAEEFIDKIESEKSDILKFEKFQIDTLPQFKNETIYEIEKRINLLVTDYSTNNKFQLVLDRTQVKYHDQNLDISNDILKLYKAKYENRDYQNKWNDTKNKIFEKYKIYEKLVKR